MESSEAAAIRISKAGPEVVLWACTSGSFLRGPGSDLEISGRITEATGIPAITTSTALQAALRAVSARSVFLLTPYIDEINEREIEFLSAAGFEVSHLASLRLADTRDIRETPSAAVARLVRDEASRAGDYDAVFISCTALHSMDQLAALEAALGKPVIYQSTRSW